jgi:hypothetical protein
MDDGDVLAQTAMASKAITDRRKRGVVVTATLDEENKRIALVAGFFAGEKVTVAELNELLKNCATAVAMLVGEIFKQSTNPTLTVFQEGK